MSKQNPNQSQHQNQVVTRQEGRYRNALRQDLVRGYLDSVEDVNMLTLTGEIGLVDTRTNELIEQVGVRPDMEKLVDALKDTAAALKAGNQARAGALLAYALNVAQTALAEDEAWQKINNQIELRRKLVESERRQAEKLGAYIRVEQVVLMMARLLNAINIHISDVPTMKRIREEFGKVMGDAQRNTTVVVDR